MASFKKWEDYFAFSGSYDERQDILESSLLGLIDPKHLREEYFLIRVWSSLVEAEFRAETEAYLNSVRNTKQVQISASISELIKLDALQGAQNPELQQKLMTLLILFTAKRPDIGYHLGMHFIGGLLLQIFEVENEAFTLFCHLIENVYPEGYFSLDNRMAHMHAELRVFETLAEELRTGLVSSLRSVKKNKNKQPDIFPFETVIKSLAHDWFSSLFTGWLSSEDELRVWDNILIYGFDFVHKFGLVLLEKHERTFKNTIKIETKNWGLGASNDVLIAAGTSAKLNIKNSLKKLPLEKMIKKVCCKQKYAKIVVNDYFEGGMEKESNHLERLLALRHTRSLIRIEMFSIESVSALEFEEDLVTRFQFGEAIQEFNWKKQLILNFFNTFDEKCWNSIEKKQVICGLALLSEGTLENKFSLIFKIFESENLEPEEAANLVLLIERTLDFRSRYFKEEKSLIVELFKKKEIKISKEKFVEFLMEESVFESLIQFIEGVLSEEYIEVDHMRISEIEEESFEEIHSPVRQTPSPISVISSEDSPEEFLSEEEPRKWESLGHFEEEKIPETPKELDFWPNSVKDSEKHRKPRMTEVDMVQFVFNEGDLYQAAPEEIKEPDLSTSIDIPDSNSERSYRNSCTRLCSRTACKLF